VKLYEGAAMTDDELREIDRRVAVAVMGWKPHLHPMGPKLSWWITLDKPVMPFFDWHPSTDIAQAWMVRNKMMERGYSCSINGGLVSFTKCDWYYSYGDPYEDKIPETICLAALKAVEGPNKSGPACGCDVQEGWRCPVHGGP